MSSALAIVISTTYTVLIYLSNTHYGSPAQEDTVAWFTVLLFVVSFSVFSLDDAQRVQIRAGRHHLVRAVTDTNMIAQLVLLLFTGHVWLFLIRAGAEFVVRAAVAAATDREYSRAAQAAQDRARTH